MARSPESIEREIAQARDALAVTLDQLSVRANPQHLAEQAKSTVRSVFANPKVRYPLIGAGALIGLLLIRKLVR